MRDKAQKFLALVALVLAIFLPPAGLILGIIAYRFSNDHDTTSIIAIVLGLMLTLALFITMVLATISYGDFQDEGCFFTKDFGCLNVFNSETRLSTRIVNIADIELYLKGAHLTDVLGEKINNVECFFEFDEESIRPMDNLVVSCDSKSHNFLLRNRHVLQIDYRYDHNGPLQSSRAYISLG